jgi:APA family basic amino acid/polyamine antiporter
MYAVFGDRGQRLIALGIIVSTFGFLDLVLLVTPRVFQAMAADGQLPPRLAQLHPRYQTPVAGIVFQAVWSSVLAGSNTYGALLDYVVFGDWIFFGATVATLFVFRSRERAKTDAEDTGGYRLPGYPIVPALFVMAAAYVVVGSILSNPVNAAIGGGLIVSGLPVYRWLGARGRKMEPPSA